MIYLYSDFGSQDIYVGQMKAALLHAAPQTPLIDLLHDAPVFDVEASAHLLHALVNRLPGDAGAVFLAIVDPGVGGTRRPVVIQADGNWFVGPDNGLLSVIAQRAQRCRVWEILWRPEQLSSSFHGRDLFAPIAARLATAQLADADLHEIEALDVVLEARDLPRIIYIDHYGNALTGLRMAAVPVGSGISANGRTHAAASVFGDVPSGTAFWYENSLGLAEIAVNGGHAAEVLGLKVGDQVALAIG